MEAEYERSLEQLRKQGTLGRLVASALEPVAVRLGSIEARLTRIEARLDELEATLHSVAEGLEDHSRQLAEPTQRLGNIEAAAGAAAEATLSRLTLEALRETGYRVKHPTEELPHRRRGHRSPSARGARRRGGTHRSRGRG